MQPLYQNVFYNPKVTGLFTDEAIVASMLRFETALARGQAEHGVIPATAAPVIDECCTVRNINVEQLTADAALGAMPPFR